MKSDTTREWIETNGLGGYAFGTSTGCPTRRYHGLLIAAKRPPVDRRLLFAGVLASAADVTGDYPLDPPPGNPAGGGAVEFSRHPFPKIIYRVGRPRRGITISREVFMPHGQNVTVLRYRLERTPPKPVLLIVRLLPAMRDHHAITTGSPHPQAVGIASDMHQLRLQTDENEAYVWFGSGRFVPRTEIVGPYLYGWETRQGMADRESFHSPGYILADLTPAGVDLIFSDRPVGDPNVDRLRGTEAARRQTIARPTTKNRQLAQSLHLAADQFLAYRGPKRKRTIVAGYPWFTDWGRDTMISLEGLTLVRGEYDAAQEILGVFAGAASRGMIPNHYPDGNEPPPFNTVDASLWFFEAGQKFLTYSKREEFVRKTLYPVYRSIIRHHFQGTRFNIHAEPETGFLFSGQTGTQLTWMDAKVGDWVVTPRAGYPVEIQALWYNALNIFVDFSRRFGREDGLVEKARRAAARCRIQFPCAFWYPEGRYLYDAISPDQTPQPDLRPNQLLALSLTYPLLTDRARGRQILSAVRKKLLTPVGLRSLSPDHPDYKSRHEGSRRDRDAAYHQGTVWTWLLGPYARATLKVEGNTPKPRQRLARILTGFRSHLETCAVGTVSEIFDGNPPHHPKGCVAQAWSVAELLAIARAIRFSG